MQHCVAYVLFCLLFGSTFSYKALAQDTTITIYGKRFAPDVIVKLNGTTISPVNIKHDSAFPSRILYVTFPLSMLQTPSATAGLKGAGATLSSSNNTNIISVQNPGSNPAFDTIYTKPRSPKIVLKTESGKIIGSNELPMLQATSLFNYDTTIVVRLEYSNFNANSTLLFRAKSATPSFEVLDIDDRRIIGGLNLPSTNGFVNVHVRFSAQKGILRDTISIDLKRSNNTATPVHSFQCTGKRRITILPFFTQKSGEPFIKIPTVGDINSVYENVGTATLMPSSADYLQQSLTILNNQILTGTTIRDPLYYTQFEFIQAPTLIPYSETSIIAKNLHTDLDALPILPKVQELDNSKIHYVLMLVNTDEAPYRAFAKPTPDCSTCLVPKYIVVEAKYVHTFIDTAQMQVENQFFDDIMKFFR
jgi:hypothetical protein